MDAAGMAGGKVRVGLVTAHLTRAGGGVYTSVRDAARALEEKRGVEVEVFGPELRGEELVGWEGMKLRTARAVGPGFFAFAPGLTGELREAELDLVHLHGLWMHPSVACAGFTRQTGRAHMVSPHGMLDAWALHNSGWKKRLAAAFFENRNLRSAACVHALNAAEEESIRDYGYGGPVCVIPNGVTIPAAGEAAGEMPWWMKKAPEKKTLLYVGRLHPKKGLPNLLEAWSRLDGELREGWLLVIAGWDDKGHQGALRRMATGLGIDGTVTFSGPVFGEEKRAAFEHCDGFILPSLSEGLPMVLLEAWAYGKPVMMTPQCNLPEGYETGAAMRIEPEGESIREGLTRFLGMGDRERREMGAKGRELAASRFSWKVVAGELADVYRWVAGQGPRPGTVKLP